MKFRILIACGQSRLGMNVNAANTAQALSFATKLAEQLAPVAVGDGFRMVVKPIGETK